MTIFHRFGQIPLLAFATVTMIPACTPVAKIATSTPATHMSEQRTPHSGLILKPGQSGMLDDSAKLHYLRVVNDSRCPQDVQCVWAGEVTVELMLEANKANQIFTMKDDGKAVSVSGYSIELIWIDRNHSIQVEFKKNQDPS